MRIGRTSKNQSQIKSSPILDQFKSAQHNSPHALRINHQPQNKKSRNNYCSLAKPDCLQAQIDTNKHIQSTKNCYLKLSRSYHSTATINHKTTQTSNIKSTEDLHYEMKKSNNFMQDDLQMIVKRTKQIIQGYSNKLTEAGTTISQLKVNERILKKKINKYQCRYGKI